MTNNDVTWLTLVRPLVESSSSPPQPQRTQLKIVPCMRPVLGRSVLFTNIQNAHIILQTVRHPTSSWAGNNGDCWEILFGGVIGYMCGYMTTEKTHNAIRCNSVLQCVFSATHCKSLEDVQATSVDTKTEKTLVWVYAQCREKTHMRVHTVERTFICVHAVCALVCVHVVCSLMCACTLMRVRAMSVNTHELCPHSLCLCMCLRHTHGTHTLECTFMLHSCVYTVQVQTHAERIEGVHPRFYRG